MRALALLEQNASIQRVDPVAEIESVVKPSELRWRGVWVKARTSIPRLLRFDAPQNPYVRSFSCSIYVEEALTRRYRYHEDQDLVE